MREDSLIPAYLQSKLAQLAIDATQITLPFCHSEEAGILNTDICSFTKITEQVSAKGHYGVEIMIDILNTYFTAMVACIDECGGSLLKYGGDSIFAIFPGTAMESIPRMMRAKDKMFEKLEEINLVFSQKYGINVLFDGAMKYGLVNLNIVGDDKYHLDYYVDGEAVNDLFHLGGLAASGTIELDIEIATYQDAPYLQYQIDKSGYGFDGHRFVPQKVLKKIQEKGFTAELRNTAVIFVHLCAKNGSSQIDVRDYHDIYQKIQHNVYNLDGTINKIDYTDKGYLILITFGTPYNHTDDIERAFTCAYRIHKISSEAICVRIGVTYSNIFAGILGSPERHEYGIIGNAVNTAARLMANSGMGEISFSEEMLPNVASRFETVFVEETQVKGIRKSIRIHKIIKEVPDSWFTMESKYRGKELVVYSLEVDSILQILNSGENSYVVLSGKAGTGKSFVAYQILNALRQQGRDIDLFIMEEFNQHNQGDWLIKMLSRYLLVYDPRNDFFLIEQYCSKAGIVLDSELLQRYFSALSDSDVELVKEEFDIVYNVLAELFCSILDCSVLFIDDIQWMDSSSYQVFSRSISKLLQMGKSIFIGSRAETDIHTPHGFESKSHHLKLGNLNLASAQKMIEREIPVISKDAVIAIHGMTNGNPLFMVEMTKVIRKNIDVENSILAESDLKRMEKEGIISDTIENLLINEYENLEENSQKMLKIASIIGKAFALDDLKLVSEAEIKKDYQDIISSLSQNRIIGQKTFDPGIEYVFQNHLMRDAIYRTILLSEKKSLHARMAEFYERKYASNLHPYLELIANHYIYADEKGKAIFYAMEAGEKTARLAAYPESNYYFEKALSFSSDPTQSYHIRLSIVTNGVNQGDAVIAGENLDLIEQMYPTLMDDELYLQKTRMLLLKGQFPEAVEYIKSILPKLCNSEISFAIKLRYMDALQFINNLDEFLIESNTLKEALAGTKNPKLIGDYYTSMALYHLNRSEYPLAKEYYLDLQAVADRSGDMIHLRIALNGMGIIASRTGNNTEAMRLYDLSLLICEKLGDRNGYSKLIMDIGIVLRREGDFAKAIEYYKKSLQTAEIIGNQNHQSTALYNLGEASYQLGDFEAARDYLNRSLTICERLNDVSGLTYCYDALGDVHFTTEDYDTALQMYTKNEKLQLQLRDREGLAHTYGNLGNIAKTNKDYIKAEEYYLMQIHILQDVVDPEGEGKAWFNFAMIELERDRMDSCKEKVKKALELFISCGAQPLVDFVNQVIQDYNL